MNSDSISESFFEHSSSAPPDGGHPSNHGLPGRASRGGEGSGEALPRPACAAGGPRGDHAPPRCRVGRKCQVRQDAGFPVLLEGGRGTQGRLGAHPPHPCCGKGYNYLLFLVERLFLISGASSHKWVHFSCPLYRG